MDPQFSYCLRVNYWYVSPMFSSSNCLFIWYCLTLLKLFFHFHWLCSIYNSKYHSSKVSLDICFFAEYYRGRCFYTVLAYLPFLLWWIWLLPFSFPCLWPLFTWIVYLDIWGYRSYVEFQECVGRNTQLSLSFSKVHHLTIRPNVLCSSVIVLSHINIGTLYK